MMMVMVMMMFPSDSAASFTQYQLRNTRENYQINSKSAMREACVKINVKLESFYVFLNV